MVFNHAPSREHSITLKAQGKSESKTSHIIVKILVLTGFGISARILGMVSNEVFSTFFSIQVAMGITQAVALIRARRCNRRSNLTMAAFVITCVILSFDSYLNFTGRITTMPHLVRAFTPFYALYGVWIYLYSKCLTDRDFKYDKKSLLYFIPFLAVLGANFPVYLLSPEQKVAYYEQAQDMNNYRLVVYILVNISNITFTVLAYYRLKKFHESVKNFYSNLAALQFRWVENLFIAAFLFVTITFGLAVFNVGSNFANAYVYALFGLLAITIFMGYSALTKVDPLFQLVDHIKKDQKAKTDKKAFTPEQIQEYSNKIESLLNEQKIFTDPDLTISKMSDMAKLPAYLVSQFINQHYQQSFHELINLHRVEEAKTRLASSEYEHLTIIAIAEDVGFNSKSTFNASFKKITGKTPSSFRSPKS